MTTTQVVETSVTVNNSPIQDYSHSDDHAQLTYELHICWQSKQTSQQLQSNQVKRSRR